MLVFKNGKILNDLYTWTWQIGYIMPQYDLSYDSMENANFKKR